MSAKWIKGKVFMSDEELKNQIIKLTNRIWVEFINAEDHSEHEAELSDFYEALRRTLDILDENKTIESRLKHLLQSDAVRLYDEIAPTISGGYKRDISELDHLVFDSKREESKEKTAHWDICCDGYYPFCSHCGEAAQHMSRFCPNCGRKMITRRHEDT